MRCPRCGSDFCPREIARIKDCDVLDAEKRLAFLEDQLATVIKERDTARFAYFVSAGSRKELIEKLDRIEKGRDEHE